MNKLLKEKRFRILAAAVPTLLVVAALWYTLIQYQQNKLQDLRKKRAACDIRLSRMLETKKNAGQIEAQLKDVSHELDLKEADMASGDLYSSMVSTIRKFKLAYNVDIPQFNAGTLSEVNLLPSFPYKQFTLNIAGTAYYYDLGKFIADFENQFPASRVLNLELSPASAQSPDEQEKLSFRMDIVSLVKTGD